MYLNDHVTNVIEKKSVNLSGCLGCDSGSCGTCPLKKSSGLGFDASSFASTGASMVGNVIPIPGAGPILGGIASIFSSLFGGGMTKEQKQSGPYFQSALKGMAKNAQMPTTQADMIDFMNWVVAPPDPSLKKAFNTLCGSKWCPGLKSDCSGAGARGCQFILPYQVYKQLNGPYSTANPAYDTFGGGLSMMQGQIIPYFKQLLSQYPASGGTAGTVSGAVQNYWPLLLIGGLVYLGSGRRSA